MKLDFSIDPKLAQMNKAEKRQGLYNIINKKNSGSGAMPPESDLNKLEYGSYKENLQVPGYQVLAKSPTIVFYKRINDNTVIIAVRGSADSRDWLGTNTLLPFNALTWSARYKEDKKFVADHLPKYAQGNDVYVVGHSLGGAIANQLQKDFPIIKGGLSFNPAYQPLDFVKKSKVGRKYTSGDPLGKLGRFLPGAEVEDNSELLDIITPSIGVMGKSHRLDSFQSGKDNSKDPNLVKTAKTSFNPLGSLSKTLSKTLYNTMFGGRSRQSMQNIVPSFTNELNELTNLAVKANRASKIKKGIDEIKQGKNIIDNAKVIADNSLKLSGLRNDESMDLLNRSRGGADTNGYELHAVIVKKKGYNKKDAEREALKITHKKTIFSRDTQLTYRFRNIPKTKFEPKSFRTKIINPNISLVFGKLK
jgi:hypothetical protein